MRTLYLFALVISLLIVTGCSTTGTNSGCEPNGGQPWNGWGNGDSSGSQSFGDRVCKASGFRFGMPSFGKQNGATGNCGSGDCGSGNCGSGDWGSGGCASGNCSTEHSFSDYQFDCGPMCGAYLSEEQCSNPTGDCESCKVGASYVKGQVGNWLGDCKLSMPKFGFGKSCNGRGCGDCQDCCTQSAGPLSSCKGLGGKVGCFGCRDCGGGSAVGLNNSQSAGGGNCTGLKFCRCKGCMSRARRAGSLHPYGGEIPHTAANGAGATGFGGGNTAPSYAYPYYTTRGPRDFLQDGCGPPPVYPSNPRPNCLPTIGR